jgi:hypothetical protein
LINLSTDRIAYKTMGGGYGLDSHGSGYDPVRGSCKHSNVLFNPITGRKFLD